MTSWIEIEARFRQEITELALQAVNATIRTKFLENSEKKLKCLRLLYENYSRAALEYPFCFDRFSSITMKDIYKKEGEILAAVSRLKKQKREVVCKRIKKENALKRKAKSNTFHKPTARIIYTPMK